MNKLILLFCISISLGLQAEEDYSPCWAYIEPELSKYKLGKTNLVKVDEVKWVFSAGGADRFPYACAKIEVKTSDGGKVVDVRYISGYPNAKLARASVKAFKKASYVATGNNESMIFIIRMENPALNF